jgi:VanZ family protein
MQRLSGDKLKLGGAIAAHISATVAMLWPSPDLPDIDVPMADKWAHFLVFGVLYFLWALALSKSAIIQWTWRLALVLLFYGIIIEVLQAHWYVSRTGDLMDVAANSIGILLGLIAFDIKEKLYP